MKFSAIVSTVLCLGATQLVGAEETLTSTVTTTITRTLVRVNAVTPSATPSTSSAPIIPTSYPASSSTLVPTSTAVATATVTNMPEEPQHTGNMAAGLEGNLPVALAGGAFALLFGAL
ncbi:hypothetical protein BJX61DRAFT_541883 [Aspergillus egyptiacus]|nr:hypothetical protein BJX61DRAFT_541883 [Aspergillus egyptiacus]